MKNQFHPKYQRKNFRERAKRPGTREAGVPSDIYFNGEMLIKFFPHNYVSMISRVKEFRSEG